MWDAFIGAQISHIFLPQSPSTSGTRDCGEQTLNLVQYQPEDAERRLLISKGGALEPQFAHKMADISATLTEVYVTPSLHHHKSV